MRCQVCEQLEESLAKSRNPDSPDLLLGLTEAGMRNRTHQRSERALKAAADLEKHIRSCTKRNSDAEPAAEAVPGS